MSKEASPTIGALAPWFGAKRTLGPEIARALGDHASYWEPFCGSMAVLMGKPPSRTEVVNDLHGDLVNLARIIQDARLGPALYRRLRRVLTSEELFRESLAIVRNFGAPDIGPDIDRAFHYFIASWQGMNGVAGTSSHNTNFARRFTNKGGDAGARWTGAVRSIPAWRRRLARVQVLRSDAFDLLEKIGDEPGTVIYCDPPYLKKGAKYLHDFNPSDHERLAMSLFRFRRARVVVSYYDHPKLATLYPGWHVRRIDVAKSLVNQGRRDDTGAVVAHEVLLINHDPYLDAFRLSQEDVRSA